MISRIQRISRKEFVLLQSKKSTFYKAPFFSVRFYKTHQENPAKFACIIAKKTLKRAVYRNNVRRKVYNYLKKEFSRFPQGSYIVCYPQKELLTMTHKEISLEFDKMMEFYLL